MTTKKHSRRSWLIVPADQADVLTPVQPQGADVIVLDLEYTVPPKNKESARAGLSAQIAQLAAASAQVFVRVDRATRWADVRAAISRGLTGIVLPSPEEPADIAEIDGLITEL